MSKTLIAVCLLLIAQACVAKSMSERMTRKCNIVKKRYLRDCQTAADRRRGGCRSEQEGYEKHCGGAKITAGAADPPKKSNVAAPPKKSNVAVDCDSLKGMNCGNTIKLHDAICIRKMIGDASKCGCYKKNADACAPRFLGQADDMKQDCPKGNRYFAENCGETNGKYDKEDFAEGCVELKGLLAKHCSKRRILKQK